MLELPLTNALDYLGFALANDLVVVASKSIPTELHKTDMRTLNAGCDSRHARAATTSICCYFISLQNAASRIEILGVGSLLNSEIFSQ